MVKRILIVVVGIFISAIVTGIIEMGIGHQIFPPPADLDITNKEMMGDYISNLNTGALAFVVLGWMIGPLVGSFVANKILPEHWRKNSIAIGVALTVFGVLSMMMFPHPIWMWIIGIIAPIIMAYIGGVLAVGRKKDSFA